MEEIMLYCPDCGNETLRFIERTEPSDDEVKEVLTCDGCEIIVYIVRKVE